MLSCPVVAANLAPVDKEIAADDGPNREAVFDLAERADASDKTVWLESPAHRGAAKGRHGVERGLTGGADQ